MLRVFNAASKIAALPGLGMLSPPALSDLPKEDLDGYLACQRLAQAGVADVSSHLREGWTEQQAARLLNTWLRDHGVRSFFHEAFVWYGERTRFRGVRKYRYQDFLPSSRIVLPGEVYILDVAPIFEGYICDIGFTASLGENPELLKAQRFLDDLRDEIPRLFETAANGAALWRNVDARIKEEGYDCIHRLYPFGVLGHRVHRVRAAAPSFSLINFGLQSYWELLSRGVFGQLLNQSYEGNLKGVWAIEPHIGAQDFGAKFEEILVFDEDGARWLADLREPTFSG